ncbi:permease [Desulfobacter postgatei]|uniref:permease n=1 Tax=Desulfobacter postgatei TaxID=2293 RepID=UPI00387E0DFC
MNFAFGDLLTDIAKPFTIGVIIAGFITFFFPSGISTWSQNNSLLSMLIMLVAGIPMYVCATSSTPIAAALILAALLARSLFKPSDGTATTTITYEIYSL